MQTVDDKIIVQAIDDSLKKSSMWIITDTREDRPYRWTVIAVWPWRTLENWEREVMSVKVWDMVFFTRYWPDEFEHEWQKYYSIRQWSILAFDNTNNEQK